MAGTLAWERIGSQFFRNVDGPTMQWNINPSQFHVRAAYCGGLVAVWDRENVIVKHTNNAMRAGSNTSLHELKLFDSQGVLFNSINLDFGSVVDVLITPAETVVILTKSGLVRHYTDLGANFLQFRLPFEIQKGVISANGYLVQSCGSEFVLGLITNLEEPRYHIVKLPNTEVCNWSLIPADETQNRASQIIVLISSHEKGSIADKRSAYLYDLNLSETSKRKFGGEFVSQKLIASPNGALIAFSDGSYLQVYEYSQSCDVIPRFNGNVPSHSELYWIGDKGIALISREGEAEIVSLEGDSAISTTYFEEDEVALLSELDGLRIFGKHHHSMFQPVFQATCDVFKLGSLEPAAILYSCIDQMDAGSPKSEQTVRMLRPPMLIRAIETCIDSAMLEIEPKLQKRLMRAAAFGKSIIEAYDSSRYLWTLTQLRIGNALRKLPQHPLFITQHQLKKLGVPITLTRLQQRKLWGEAVKVAELEQFPIEPVYIDWACHAIQCNDKLDDNDLYDLLQSKMSKLGPYSHSKMAVRAIEQGRQFLALTLLEQEPVAHDRVRLLLEINMTQASLEQATRCGNPYLVDYVLMVLTDQLSTPQLIRIIGNNTMAIGRQQLLVQLSESPDQRLHEFLYHMDLRTQSLHLEFDKICEMNKLLENGNSEDKADHQKQIQNLRALEKKYNSLNKHLIPDSHVCTEWADLLVLQKQLEVDYHYNFVGLSASQTIALLLKIPQVGQAQKLKSKLGISDRQFWWLRISALVERRDFDILWDFSQSKKSPIGYLPFYEACYEAGNLEYASKFVNLVMEATIEEKIKMYMTVKNINAAKELATKSRDPNLVAMVSAM